MFPKYEFARIVRCITERKTSEKVITLVFSFEESESIRVETNIEEICRNKFAKIVFRKANARNVKDYCSSFSPQKRKLGSEEEACQFVETMAKEVKVTNSPKQVKVAEPIASLTNVLDTAAALTSVLDTAAALTSVLDTAAANTIALPETGAAVAESVSSYSVSEDDPAAAIATFVEKINERVSELSQTQCDEAEEAVSFIMKTISEQKSSIIKSARFATAQAAYNSEIAAANSKLDLAISVAKSKLDLAMNVL